MKTFNACFIGDIEWFSARKTKGKYKSVFDALKAHLRYISNSSHAIKVYGKSLNRWKELAEEETSKRWDARIAGKFFLTLPNDLTPEQALNVIKAFLEGWIGTKEYTIALHLNKGFISEEENLHAHIVFYPRDEKGKRISFDKERLKELHKAWRIHLQKYGYIVPEVPEHLKRRKIFIDRRNPDLEAIQKEREYYHLRKEALGFAKLQPEKKQPQRIITNLKIKLYTPETKEKNTKIQKTTDLDLPHP